ncbi:hypothetical protein KFK09_018247 [Dendrobium nobile]|uniref:Uncharacterized protein n=1 Tax=Dendrobium nobile TaxID=94219 RepID=A0A8T3AUR5_DENNO|nr:hypothetical protein KFK09_018247 [Dendrobium nobile]
MKNEGVEDGELTKAFYRLRARQASRHGRPTGRLERNRRPPDRGRLKKTSRRARADNGKTAGDWNLRGDE